MEHILSVEQFDKKSLESLFKKADEFQKQINNPSQRRDLAGKYLGRQMCSLFYEPSTRTRLSFEKAAVNLGLSVVSTENAREFSSAAKGETLEDTIRVIDSYGFDVIVMRHHETGAAARAAKVSETPIINAGDGKGEHPTQALLDVDTIYRKFGRLDNLNVVIGGDLANGRTARSLAQMISKYDNNRINFVSIEELKIGEDIKKKLKENGTQFEETDDLQEAFVGADVVYWTRLQKERLEHPEWLKDKSFVIDKKALNFLPKTAIIMHPLPRVDEISVEVDSDPRAVYFEQAKNGLYIRMALIDEILERE
jgi:aspartate carbamoyltransferase catalytic subunit